MTHPTFSPTFVPPLGAAISGLGRVRRRPARVLAILAVGSHLLGCTLTASDFVAPATEQTNVGSETLAPPLRSEATSPPGRDDSEAPPCGGAADCSNPEAASPEAPDSVDPGQAQTSSGTSPNSCAQNSCDEPAPPNQTPPCQDGQITGAESDVDCGGACEVLCQLGQRCNSSDDCEAQLLCTTQGSVCAPPACDDAALNGAETDVDCGGAECPPCAAQSLCTRPSDCQSGVCGPDGQCAIATCLDGVSNQGESQVDCGLGPCLPCAEGVPCTEDAECQSATCEAGLCAPEPTCQDELLNRDESDVDCGGLDPNCNRCPDLAACNSNSDCNSGLCDQGVCASCNDGVANGGESGVDCGGSSVCGSCSEGSACNTDSDCNSGACQDGACCGGSGRDCTRCAARLSSDACTNDQCTQFLQCLRDNSDVCSTRFASGCAIQSTDPCFHGDFGGEGGPGVQKANQVLVNASCPL